MGMLSKTYNRLLVKYPLITPAVQTGALMGVGDTIAQFVIEQRSLTEYSFVRTVQFSAIGTLLVGPVLTTWYRLLAAKFGSGGVSVALKKMACDQILFAPCFITIFLTTLGTVQRHSFAEIKSDIKRDYFDIIVTNYTIWPAVQILNFAVVPVQYQVLLVQLVAIFWNSYLSWKTQKYVQK